MGFSCDLERKKNKNTRKAKKKNKQINNNSKLVVKSAAK